MQVLTKSIRIIDYENNRVYSRITPDTFDEYISELISHINSNDSVRDFKTRSLNTEVISCAKEICNERVDEDLIIDKTDTIANRLLAKEIEAQGRVARMNTNVQKGSLVQALLYDEDVEKFTYLLAKVEHSNFVDDTDFSFKSGFSKDKKTLWKSCLIEILPGDVEEYHAKIYSNTVAKYWSDDFLELDEMISDESNTTKAFRAIEGVLNRNVKSIAPRDHTIIRNSIISYFKNNAHFDYNQMLDSALGSYQTTDLTADKLASLKEKLGALPETKKFDRQFSPIASIINARIKKVYEVNSGIEIRITDEIPDIANTIQSCRENDGAKYIKIRTNNEDTFKRFLNN